MSLVIDRPASKPRRSAAPNESAVGASCLRIGLLNNMPDSALESTELQFIQLLQRAAGADLPVRLRLACLPELPRNAAAHAYMRPSYWALDDLMSEPLDGLIVTGTEPRAPRLQDEGYWPSLTRVIEWAESNTTSAIWSCLAAHGAVLYLDGVARRRLPDKCCGVYEHTLTDHPLTDGLRAPLHTPHSRWNELPVEAVRAAGYDILSDSPLCGLNLFARQCKSLFLFVQGHPEYDDISLLKEYRRDVGRYLRSEQAHYPTLPHDYVSGSALESLTSFRSAALAQRDVALFEAFPYEVCAASLVNKWSDGASRLYRNWLTLLACGSGQGRPAIPELARVARQG